MGAKDFVGQGRSKKLAKNNAALQALKTLHGINHFARRGQYILTFISKMLTVETKNQNMP